MIDLISRQDAYRVLTEYYHHRTDFQHEALKDALGKVPTIQPKRGEWIYDAEAYPLGNPYGHYDCDQCGESVPSRTNYCPNCGAKMEV